MAAKANGIAAKRLTNAEYAQNFTDLHPPLTDHEALVEADRCYFCHDAPCMAACPTSINILMFIRQISTGLPKNAAKTIFDACGRTVVLPERLFDLVTAVSGSGPAYFFFLMEVLADFGVRHGLKRKDAELFAVQTARGAAQLAASSDVSPKEWRERVTSKKGTTEAAFKVIKRSGVDKVFAKAFQAALDRGRELSKL